MDGILIEMEVIQPQFGAGIGLEYQADVGHIRQRLRQGNDRAGCKLPLEPGTGILEADRANETAGLGALPQLDLAAAAHATHMDRRFLFSTEYLAVPERKADSFVPAKGFRLFRKFDAAQAEQVCLEINRQLEGAWQWLEAFKKEHA